MHILYICANKDSISQAVDDYMHTHNVDTELVCFVCNKLTVHNIEYSNERMKSITCSTCGVIYELIIEVRISYHTENILKRILTKPHRILDETRTDFIEFIYSLPLRVVSKPYRLANEIIVEAGQSADESKKNETDIFCSYCSEPTLHSIYYFDNRMQYSVCSQCGMKIEFLCLVVKYKNYPEEIIHRIVTKPERILKELHSQRSSLLYSIPIRVVTKPYRLLREFVCRFRGQ